MTQKGLKDGKAHHQRALMDKYRTPQIVSCRAALFHDFISRTNAEFVMWADVDGASAP